MSRRVAGDRERDKSHDEDAEQDQERIQAGSSHRADVAGSDEDEAGSLPTCRDVVHPWDFVFVGMNLMFDFHFLNERAKVYGLRGLDLSYCYDHPFLDLKHVLVFINNGRFTGYSQVLKGRKCLDRIDVPKRYMERRFQEILDYIKNEAELFGKALVILRREMPSLQEYFRG